MIMNKARGAACGVRCVALQTFPAAACREQISRVLPAECIRCTDGLGPERLDQDARGRAGRTSTDQGQRLATESARQARVRSPTPLGGGSGESGGWPCGEVRPGSAQCAWRGVAATTPHTRRGSRADTRARGHARARAPGGGRLVARGGAGRGGDGGEGWRRACRGRGGVAPGLATGLATGWATGGDGRRRVGAASESRLVGLAEMHVPLPRRIE